METAILLAVAASLCMATSSVCQRMGAKSSQAPPARCAPEDGPLPLARAATAIPFALV